MNTLLSAVQQHAGLIAAAACVLGLCLLIWLVVLTRRLRLVTPQMRHLVRDMEGMNAADMFAAHVANAEMTRRWAADATALGRELSERQRTCLQRVGLVKYNAEEGLGGEMSFSAALLDESDTGFILTSIYRLEECRIYAKRVEGGLSQQQLSQEEQQVLDEALAVGRTEEGD
ncbi:MAG: DUF4446 family protein [Armatimonadota bacterium]|jgi:hypothetical protein